MIDNALKFASIEDKAIAVLYDAGIIANGYLNIGLIESKLHFQKLQKEFGYRKNFKQFIKEMMKKGWFTDCGKHGKVVSLTEFAVKYIIAKYPVLLIPKKI